jgi:hypothetical protein
MTATYDHDHDRDVEITVTDARGQLGKLLDTHVNDGGVVYLMRNGRRVGAVVAPDVPEKLEALEDDYWSQRAADVLAKGEPTVPWDQALALLESGNADQ